eukprot:TRINITY_DN1672_c0_g1_i1.p1 TRINITY_DN1672_c0_g1~~TRINITY_DN1672_c0_g1_i1.p1  ORF type:complete len:67 (-),score=1.06 TRINITY_DN1672_c0_g1_i1:240-440(-)
MPEDHESRLSIKSRKLMFDFLMFGFLNVADVHNLSEKQFVFAVFVQTCDVICMFLIIGCLRYRVRE